MTNPAIEALYRLAGRHTPGEHCAKLGTVPIHELRPRVAAAMLDLILMELETEGVTVQPTAGDLTALLGSDDQRVRVLGLRLAAQATTTHTLARQHLSGSPADR
jgi:hypothetical protein